MNTHKQQSTMATQAFCLRRNNHLNDMVVDLEEMLKDENMVDVALSCEEGIIKAHKIILSACSTYFRQIFSKVQLNNQYPIIIIKDMSYQDLKYIIDFIYRGEVLVPQQHLNSVLKSAEALKIKGLADINSNQSKLLKEVHSLSSCGSNRKKKKKRRKHTTSLEERKDTNKNVNSSEELSEYSDEDNDILHHNNLQSIHHQLNTQLLQSTHHNSPALNETEIEPSRLLEQSMITGDAQNIANIQSTNHSSSQNKYPQYLLSSVKQMIYDDSSSLIASQLVSNDQSSLSSNHNLAQFEESGTLAGPSSIFNKNDAEVLDDDFDADQLLNNSPLNALDSVNASSQLSFSNTLQNLSQSISNADDELTPNTSNKRKPSYQCNICLKRFDIRYSLQRHLKVIHNPQRHLFTCHVCNKKFAWKSALLRHVNVTCGRQQQKAT